MDITDLEAEILKLAPEDRARLAERLLQSLETLSDEESDALWTAEALRRDAELDSDPSIGRSEADVMRDARARLG